MLRSVRPFVRLIQSRLLNGGMRASPLQTHSIGGNMLGYACVHMLLAGAYRFAARYLVLGLKSVCKQKLQDSLPNVRRNRGACPRYPTYN